MDVDVTATTVEPTPTAVVAAAVTWAEFPQVWRPMLDQVWSFLRSGAAAALRGRALRPNWQPSTASVRRTSRRAAGR